MTPLYAKAPQFNCAVMPAHSNIIFGANIADIGHRGAHPNLPANLDFFRARHLIITATRHSTRTTM